ncbi:MAG: DegV family protein [Eubacteriales bacterium]|nr:DegV family protein [Eubacteriales bacterium]
MSDARKYEIYVDGSIDIDPDYLGEHGVRFIQMEYTIDGNSFVMEAPPSEEEMKSFYDKMRSGSLTGTSQITPYNYEVTFKEAAREGKDVLYLCLSSGLSNTYESSLTARRAVLENNPGMQIECVDTLGATGGTWLLLMEALRLRDEGKSLAENAAFLRENASRLCYWFMVENLDYLKRGGRISATAAFAGNVLNLKPVLKIDDNGKLIGISKQRGIPRALKFMLENYAGAHSDSPSSNVVISNADCHERAQKMADEIRRINPGANVYICSIGPVIGAHVGPGMIALMHFGNRNFR